MPRDIRETANPARIGAAILIATIAILGVRAFTTSMDGQNVVVDYAEASSPSIGEERVERKTATVYVTGAVVAPGVYEVDEGSRMIDVVDAAGGLHESAAAESCNLARKVIDGEHIHIPTIDEAEPSASADHAAEQRVNINQADAATLETLPGIGAATAAKIIAEREANGPFQTPEDLSRVSGIGQKKLEALRDAICV